VKKKKTIIFLSSANRYLEHNLYCKLAKEFPENYQTIYFESDYKKEITYNSSPEEDYNEKAEAFDKYIKIAPIALDKRKLVSLKSKFNRIVSNNSKIYSWKNEFLSLLDKATPNAIVLISPTEFNAKLAQEFREQILKIYIQPSNIRKAIKIDTSARFKLNKFIYHQILKLPFYNTNPSVLENRKNYYFLLWSGIWVSHLKLKKRTNYKYIGAPKYDKYFQSFQEIKSIPKEPAAVIYLNKELHVGIHNWDIYAEFYKGIIKNFSSINFILKAHPLGGTKRCEEKFSGSQVTTEPISLEKVDLVITHWSTVCYESISKGIPTILINPEGKFDFSEFHLQNYPAIATNIEEFTQLFANFRDSSNSKFPEYRKDFIRELLYSDDGKSTARAVNAIDKILSGTLI
jgi:hypothetical protein